jgi:hypothetical protein
VSSTVFLPKNVAPNKKVGSRPLTRATCLEAPQYNFYAAKRQEKPEAVGKVCKTRILCR